MTTGEVANHLRISTKTLQCYGSRHPVYKASRPGVFHVAHVKLIEKVWAGALMLLTDGGQSSIQDGETILIPRRTVSDAGTVTTTGYEYVKTGLIVNTALREMSSRAAICNIGIDLTQVTSYVDCAPVTSGQNFKTMAVLESGGTYLVGSLSRRSERRERKGVLVNTFSGRDDASGNIEVWLRCYRIQGSYQTAAPAPGGSPE